MDGNGEVLQCGAKTPIRGDAATDDRGSGADLARRTFQLLGDHVHAGGLEAGSNVGEGLALRRRGSRRGADARAVAPGHAADVVEYGRLQAAEREIERFPAEHGLGKVDRLRI